MIYLFELGREPLISIAELEAVFSCLGVEYKEVGNKDKYWLLDIKNKIKSRDLINILGGTIKIAEKVYDKKDVVEFLADYLFERKLEGKIEFSISGSKGEKTALQVKKELKSRGRSVRYIKPKNTATILHNNLVEKES